MLVLARKMNEKITLPELGVTIEILRTGCHQVRIGIDAPRDLRILRGELESQALPDSNRSRLNVGEEVAAVG